MPESTKLAKAELREVDARFEKEINDENWTTVQFNPETLKVAFANQLVTPAGGGDQRGTPSIQFVGKGTTKLSLQLWFDVNAPFPDGQAAVDDVRKLTQKVAYFITPRQAKNDPSKFTPPAVRFLWGSFKFDGIMDSLEESLEFFSPEGKPQRASISLSLLQQEIQKFAFGETTTPPGTGGPGTATPGARPLTPAPANATLQGLAASTGAGANWQAIAAANGIENPRLLAPGQLINMNASVAGSAAGGVSGGVAGSAAGSLNISGSSS